ncbi:MAG: 2,3-bisphosphoglycerate-independent phosphoglycerate mutase, partial [Coriobacteriales bacterium]|nr:2,3-bisphosphoglycerate-independent phosphoglycerate mutase [Coriobacteriales bacterium]
FLNGGVEEEKPGERRVLIPSPKVATYDLQPEMSAPKVAETLVAAIENDEADVYIVNFANCDMVGHTGVFDAAVKAVETVDAGIGMVVDAILNKGGIALVTADHGNAEKMLADDGASSHTAHTTSNVPLILISDDESLALDQDSDGKLANIAPTLLKLIGIQKPDCWTEKSLIK